MQKFAYVGNYADGGSQNSFYKLKGRKQGFKSFPNKSLAIFAHKVQSTLSKSDLAPRVYSPICKIRVPNYFATSDGKGGMKTITQMVLSEWGYLTEIAEPYIACENEYCDGDCAYNDSCENYDIIQGLMSDIEGHGLDYIDAHGHNLGYIKRGGLRLLVVIDVGAESVHADDDYYPNVCWDGSDIDCWCEKCRGIQNG